MKQCDYHTERTTYTGRVKYVFGGYSLFSNAEKILDWGCSYGETTKEIFKNVGKNTFVTGIDIGLNKFVVEEANCESSDKLKLVSGDGFTYFQNKGEKFDLVLAMNNVLYFMNELNQKEIMDSLGKLIKNRGRLILATDYGKFSKSYFNGGYMILQNLNGEFTGISRNNCKIKDKTTVYKNCQGYEIPCPQIFKNSKKNLDRLVKKYF